MFILHEFHLFKNFEEVFAKYLSVPYILLNHAEYSPKLF